MDSAAQTKTASQASLEPPVAEHQTSLDADLEQAKDMQEAAEWPRLREDGETYEFKDGSTWCGDPLKDSQPNGKGVFTTKGGCAFRSWLGPAPNGFFKDGQLNGYGNITKPNGYNYVGQCWRNQPHGTGRLRNDAEGYDHYGSFYAGMATGPGTEKTREMGITVTTETVWNMDQKSGLGTVTEEFVVQSGKSRVRTRTGEFVKNKRHGPWVEKTKEEGQLVVDWQGEYKDGFKDGPFKQVVYEEYGERTETAGSNKKGKYEGKIDIRTFKGAEGVTCGLSCNLVKGIRNGEGVIYLGEGRKLTGPFVAGKKHGWFLAEQADAPKEWRWYENDEEDCDKTKRRKRRDERTEQGMQKKPKVCEGCTANSQKFHMLYGCTASGPGSNTDSPSDAELEPIPSA